MAALLPMKLWSRGSLRAWNACLRCGRGGAFAPFGASPGLLSGASIALGADVSAFASGGALYR